LSSIRVRAVMKMIGMSRVAGFSFRAAATWNPSISGIMASSRMRSGSDSKACSRASLPSWPPGPAAAARTACPSPSGPSRPHPLPTDPPLVHDAVPSPDYSGLSQSRGQLGICCPVYPRSADRPATARTAGARAGPVGAGLSQGTKRAAEVKWGNPSAKKEVPHREPANPRIHLVLEVSIPEGPPCFKP